jgi:hypothetical protein
MDNLFKSELFQIYMHVLQYLAETLSILVCGGGEEACDLKTDISKTSMD